MSHKEDRVGAIFILICGGISIVWGRSMGWTACLGAVDFQAVYYGARTLIDHRNPYNVSELDMVYRADDGNSRPIDQKQHDLIELSVNTPAAVVVVPQVVLMLLTARGLIVASRLIWGIASGVAPIFSASTIEYVLLNGQVVL